MQIPAKLPGLKLVTVITAAYSIVWIGLEGALWRAALLGILVTCASTAHIMQRLFAGRTLSLRRWLSLSAAIGILIGLGSSGLTLLFMGVKTGLHAHGPEFTAVEINWMIEQIPLWSIAGLLFGFGVGLVTGKS